MYLMEKGREGFARRGYEGLHVQKHHTVHYRQTQILASFPGFPSSFLSLAVLSAFPVLQATESWKGSLGTRLQIL